MVFEESAHQPHVEHPEEFNRLLLGFLDRNSVRGPACDQGGGHRVRPTHPSRGGTATSIPLGAAGRVPQ